MTDSNRADDFTPIWLLGLTSMAVVGAMMLSMLENLAGISEPLFRIVFVGWLVSLSTWLFSASLRAHAAGIRGLDSSPGWSLAWPWVPLIGSLKVYWCLDELERSARAPGEGDWRNLQPSPWIRRLWLLLHLPPLLRLLLINLSLPAYVLARVGIAETLNIVLGLAMLPVPLIVFWLVLRIDRIQRASLPVDVAELRRWRTASMRLRFGGLALIILLVSAQCRVACGGGLGPGVL